MITDERVYYRTNKKCRRCHHCIYTDESYLENQNGAVHLRCRQAARPRPEWMRDTAKMFALARPAPDEIQRGRVKWMK